MPVPDKNFSDQTSYLWEKAFEEGRQSLLPRLSQYKRQYHIAKDQRDHFKRKTLELNERATRAEARERLLLKRIDELSEELASAHQQTDEVRENFSDDDSTWGQEGDYEDFWGEEDSTDSLADDYLVEDEP